MESVGLTYGRLTVLGKTLIKDKRNLISCQCSCGNLCEVASYRLASGHTQSCGCLRKEITSQKNKELKTTHGECANFSRSVEYACYSAMIFRCSEKSEKKADYFDRGIKVCTRWLDGQDGKTGFSCFLEDMGRRTSPRHSLDRRENNGNYDPTNCWWATRRQQTNNRRTTKYITRNGITLPLSVWAERFAIKWQTVWERIYKLGWDSDRALTEAPRKTKS